MRLLSLLLTAFLAACAAQQTRLNEAAPLVDVEVVRDSEEWTADFRFGRDAPGWAFPRSALTRDGHRPWRPESWIVLTPGVRLDRRDDLDILVAESGTVPREVRIRFRPAAVDLLADYDPALRFTDGSVAIFSDQFLAFPTDAAPEGEKVSVEARLSFRDENGMVLYAGRRLSRVTIEESGKYILFGPAEPLQTPSLAAIVDPALPDWFRDELLAFMPRALAFYTEQLGAPAGEGKPTVMVSWAGPTPGTTSQGGSVLPGLVTMALEGEGLLERNEAALEQARWFIGHESAHFWLGHTIAYESGRDAWITEGGSDLLAVRMMERIDPEFEGDEFLRKAWNDCVMLAAGKDIRGARDRQEHRAYYACGALFSLVAEAAARRSGGDYFAFWRGLIQENRADGVVTGDEWLAALDRSSGDPSLSADIGRILNEGVDDPQAVLASLFARAGIAPPAP